VSAVRRVLIVDDHRNTGESLAIGLDAVGLHADAASSAAEAVSLAERYAYDVVVSDVRMPGVDGITLCQNLLARYPSLRVVLMTAYDLSPGEHEAVRALGAALLIKPVTAATLAAYCDTLVSSRAL
jgi:DNA-binding NtrC family response regulator